MNNQLVGAIKNKGEKNMLSLKTDNNNNIPLIKNRIYILPKKVINLLGKYESSKNSQWNFINFEILYLKDSNVNLENYEKVQEVYEDKSGYERVFQNNINSKFKMWEYRKKFDIEISKDFWN